MKGLEIYLQTNAINNLQLLGNNNCKINHIVNVNNVPDTAEFEIILNKNQKLNFKIELYRNTNTLNYIFVSTTIYELIVLSDVLSKLTLSLNIHNNQIRSFFPI